MYIGIGEKSVSSQIITTRKLEYVLVSYGTDWDGRELVPYHQEVHPNGSTG